jgi:uncharacterized membrane protein YcaP (DUF421 family)
VQREPGARRALLGEPRVLVSDGTVLEQSLAHEEVTEDELSAAIREHGFEGPGDVRLAVLEVDGTISIVPKDASVVRSQRRVRQVRHGQ